jgi:predicted transcriptional regulator YdeE
MCAVEVGDFETLPPALGRMRILAQRYAVFLHRGHASAIRTTWERILAWLQESGYESAQKPDFERYDERFDPKTGVGDVEIWISIAAIE